MIKNKAANLAARLLLVILLALLVFCSCAKSQDKPLGTPFLTSPTDGSAVSETAITFKWDAATNAVKYRLMVYQDSNSPVYLYNELVGKVTSKEVTGFPNDNTVFYWKVKAYNEAGATKSSVVWSLTNGAALPPAVPVLTSPANSSTVSGTAITFKWNAVTNAVNYRLLVYENPSSPVYLYNELVGNVTSKAVSGFPSDNTVFYWKVTAYNAADATASSVVWSFINGTPSPPAVPVLTSPDNNSTVSGTSITFNWNVATDAAKYRLMVYKDADSPVYLYNELLGNVTSKEVSGFPNDNTVFCWKLTAYNAADATASSAVWSFTNGTPSPPAVPVLTSPADDSTVSGTSITFKWKAATNTVNYRLMVYENPSSPVYLYNALVGNITSKAVSGFPNDETVFYWKVIAYNAADATAFSVAQSFTNGIP